MFVELWLATGANFVTPGVWGSLPATVVLLRDTSRALRAIPSSVKIRVRTGVSSAYCPVGVRVVLVASQAFFPVVMVVVEVDGGCDVANFVCPQPRIRGGVGTVGVGTWAETLIPISPHGDGLY